MFPFMIEVIVLIGQIQVAVCQIDRAVVVAHNGGGLGDHQCVSALVTPVPHQGIARQGQRVGFQDHVPGIAFENGFGVGSVVDRPVNITDSHHATVAIARHHISAVAEANCGADLLPGVADGSGAGIAGSGVPAGIF